MENIELGKDVCAQSLGFMAGGRSGNAVVNDGRHFMPD